MKTKFKHLFILALMGIASPLFSQFNTLTPISIKEKNSKKLELQKEKNLDVEKVEKSKTIKKPFINITTKASLKREIDSLKTLMLKHSLGQSDKKKLDFRKIEDSLILMLKKNFNNSGTVAKKNIQKYDFISDSEAAYNNKIFMPIKNKLTISSNFGVRSHPIFGTKKMHNGIDIPIAYQQVYSVLDGVVTESGFDSKGGGNYIKINHFNKFETAYLHLSQIYYKVGEIVKAGFVIAKSGNSGNSTGPHLHFSVKENGKYINPTHFLNDLINANNLIATYNEK
jgi:murein DD-endopeptidase MepM/ murein hydrolase activator NlpD